MHKKVRITRSARRHKIGNAHMRAALVDAVLFEVDGDYATYHGTDDRGIELELGIIPDDRNEDGYALVHCMPRAFRGQNDKESE